MSTIDWNTPIEYIGGGTYPARLLGEIKTQLGRKKFAIAVDLGTQEVLYTVYDDGRDCQLRQIVRNVPETTKKTFWTVTLLKDQKPAVASKVFDTKPKGKVGGVLPGYTGYTILNIAEVEVTATP